MRHYCTYFDINYVPRALALYHSLGRTCSSFRLFALCLDDESYELLTQQHLPNVVPISHREMEECDASLANCKANRSRVEYYYTYSPCLPLFIVEKYPEIDLITYLDADLYFYSDPEVVFDEMQGHSIGIIEHRFPPRLQAFNANGKYNVGWITFRNDEQGLQCLRWWRDRCIEWCYERREDGKYADQGYLDEWPDRFPGVHVIQHQGANVAPWNVANYEVTNRDKMLWVDDYPLVFFHFHGLKEVRPWLFDSNLGRSGARVNKILRQQVFGTYLAELARHSEQAPLTAQVRDPSHRHVGVARWARNTFNIAATLLSRSYIVRFREQYF